MRVRWTPEAQTHLDGIYQYIKRDAPFYAQGVVDKLTRRSMQLIDHPHSGCTVPTYDDPNLRELIVYPYRLITVDCLSHRRDRRFPWRTATARRTLGHRQGILGPSSRPAQSKKT